MIARRHLRWRLSQYGALWLGGFVVTLLVMSLMVFAVGMPVAETADLTLPIAFAVLGLAVIAGVGISVVKDVSLTTKSLITVLALLLILPLLWAPVLAVAITAAIAGASVEYSTAYAQFRITVSPPDLSAGRPAGRGSPDQLRLAGLPGGRLRRRRGSLGPAGLARGQAAAVRG